jgi:hypothetical protein
MEQLLNLFWAMLALPAAVIWWRQRRFAQNLGHLCSSPSFVLLGCVLVLLFPVVSATDDVNALRAEIEETSPIKRVVKQAASLQCPTWANDGGSPAHLIQDLLFRPANETCGKVSKYLPVLAEQAPASAIGCRAPPVA